MGRAGPPPEGEAEAAACLESLPRDSVQYVVQQSRPLCHDPLPPSGVVGQYVGQAEAAGHVEEALDGFAYAWPCLVGLQESDRDAVGLAADAGFEFADAGVQ